MGNSIWTPTDNYVLVAVPERFESAQKFDENGKPKARLILPSGSDDWETLTNQLKAGINADIETDEVLIPIRQGQVLAVCERLTADMALYPSPHTKLAPAYRVVQDDKGKAVLNRDKSRQLCTNGYSYQSIPRTAADITQRVAVGDTVVFDPYALHDESEVSPGVYRIGYVDLIAVIVQPTMTESGFGITLRDGKPWYHFLNNLELKRGFEKGRHLLSLKPIGGYVLLARAWASDVEEAEVEGMDGLHKVRYLPTTSPLTKPMVAQVDVPPLLNEGIVVYHSSPLRGTKQEVQVGSRVIFDPATARIENIGGTEYIAVRHEFILAERLPIYDSPKQPFYMVDEWATKQSEEPGILQTLLDISNDSEFMKQLYAERTQQMRERMSEYLNFRNGPQYLPLEHPAYNS